MIILVMILSFIILFIYSSCVVASRADDLLSKEDFYEVRRIEEENK
jgi:hypothetical protein